MSGNFIKTTWRSLVKDRQFAVLNLVGLSVALACVLLIYLWVSDELNVDKFHTNSRRLYQVMSHIKLPDGIHTQEATPYMFSRAVAKEMPEVEDATCYMQGFIKGTLSAGEKKTQTTKHFVDYHFFNVFSFSLLSGNKNTLLDDKYSIVISDKLARKLFNTTENLIGKTIQWENDPNLFTVTGVFEEPSSNSSLKFDALFSYESFFQNNPDTKDWSNSNPSTFILVKKGIDAKQFETKLTPFLHAKSDKSPLTLSLRKFSDRYLYNNYENGVLSGGRIRYVRLFSIIAAFILMIACINFMNLSTAKAARRLKEAGIKKILGAERSGLIFQYIGESIMMAFVALLIALLLVLMLLPQFNMITGKQLSIPNNASFIIAVLSIGLITGLLAGSYPAFYLSGFKPIAALKGKLNTIWGELWMRKGLVVFQYTLSVTFIIAVMVIYKQMHLIQTMDLGYAKDNIISIKNEKKIGENYEAFTHDVQHIQGVMATSSINGDMFGNSSGSTEKAKWDGNTGQTKILMTDLDIDYGLIELMGMKMKAGRSFSKDFATDSLGIILNESAVNAMGIKDPVGKSFIVWGGNYHIVGVTKDFHFESLYEKVKPCFMRLNKAGGNILIKVHGGKEREVIAQLNEVYKKYNPGVSFSFTFLDKDYEAMYTSEERESVLFRWFAGLAIIISCLGLFGLAAFSAQKRQKEMSIRKVVGASTSDIATLLSKDFFQLIILSMLIAFPL
ncbi:MAG: ABC transporter permease, partial [Bacteroidetes bacterium]|nr:ABC transporter permease [Bacteroidota bacterium]